MDKIELTDLQKQLIQKQLNEKYDPFMATEEEQEAFNDVIDLSLIHISPSEDGLKTEWGGGKSMVKSSVFTSSY